MSSIAHSRTSCPACASADIRPVIDRLDFHDSVLRRYFHEFYPAQVSAHIASLNLAPGVIYECGDCGTIFHGTIPAADVLGSFYSALQAATLHEETAALPHREEQRLLELMMVVRFLQPRVPRPSVLDFGTGDGSWARLAAAAGCVTAATDTACEPFPSLRAAGIACFSPDELPPDSFDFINSEQVFEHLADPCAVLSRLVASLKPGGVLKIGVPYDPRLREKLASPDWAAPKSSDASMNSIAPIEHLNAFSPEGLVRMGCRCDLEPLSVSGWTLESVSSPPRKSLRQKFMRCLRDRLGQRHRPPYALAQTRFFLRAPNPST